MPAFKPHAYASILETAVKVNDGETLGQYFELKHSHSKYLFSSLPDGDNSLDYAYPSYVQTYRNNRKLNSGPWAEMAILHTQSIIALNDRRMDPLTGGEKVGGDAMIAFEKQHELVNTFYKWLIASTAANGWALPLLYAICRDLRKLGVSADVQRLQRGEKAVKLEQASRLLQKCFSACLNDRSTDVRSSRKIGTYYMATLLFKTYFKLKSTALCKNLIKGIEAADLLNFAHHPISHQVTYNYYMGVFAFLREDYVEAEKKFEDCLLRSHAKAHRNIELILDYLIPILLLRGVLPSSKLFKKQTRLAALYGPFVEAFKTGNVALYDEQLQKGEKRLMDRGTYLIVERAREGAVRKLMKAAWIIEGKPARMTIERFQHYYTRGAGIEIDEEEVECLLANLIYKGSIKGYISHAHKLVVLSKDKPFPWYATFAPLTETEKKERDKLELENRQSMNVTAGVKSITID